ncbi:hypothetical protein PMm318_A36870 [Pseudomonas moorei]
MKINLRGTVLARGLMLYEVGTDHVGLDNVGATARAQGPSTLASNVAEVAFILHERKFGKEGGDRQGVAGQGLLFESC